MEDKQSRAAKTEATREAIIEAGRMLFRKHGYANVQVSAIVKQAGVSVGTFYYHFKSKGDLFSAVCHDFNSVFQLDPDIDYQHDDFTTRMVVFFEKYADYIQALPYEKIATAFLHDYGNKTFLDPGRSSYHVLSVMIEGFQKSGKIEGGSPMKIVKDLFICARGVVYDWLLHERDYSLRIRMREIMERITPSYILHSDGEKQ